MNIAAIIVGIDGWERYTLPLIQSIREHEPYTITISVLDNASKEPYQGYAGLGASIHHSEDRLCYSAAINYLHDTYAWKHTAHDGAEPTPIVPDWYIVLSNDVLCTDPFAHILAEYDGSDLVGPLLKQAHGFDYLEGWCVCVPAKAWQPWDERFLGSDYEDVAYSTAARQRGFGLVEDTRLPFTHLDQRQRFHIVEDFAGKNAHNRELFLREYAAVTA